MSKIFYRFRSIDSLLSKYNELEKQNIYFAQPEELNDPMEGYRDTYWSGDFIVWKNLFKHYLLCLERLCSFLLIAGEDYPILDKYIPIFSGENDFPTSQYKELFTKISNSFFKNKSLSVLIKKISSRTTPIRVDELYFYLSSIHPIALKIIFSIYKESKLVSSELIKDDISNKVLDNLIQYDFVGLLERTLQEKEREEKVLNVIFSAQKHVHTQMDIIQRYNGTIDNNTTNKNLVLIEFPKKYISLLEKLVFPNWYTACFMADCSNSSVWGHYGDNHSGICLMFKSEEMKNNFYLNLKGINGHGCSGPLYGYTKHKFHPIDYVKGYGQIDFFRSLGRLPRPTLNSIWYTDDEGKISTCADDIFKSEDKWRNKYWDNFYRDILVKSKDWKYENEHRLILSSSLDSFSEKKDRVLKYDFASLEGVIFGIKTKIEDKLKVIKIIETKCKEINRKDFKFYQAYYSSEDKCIKHSEMSLLKFNYKRNQ